MYIFPIYLLFLIITYIISFLLLGFAIYLPDHTVRRVSIVFIIIWILLLMSASFEDFIKSY